MSKTIIKPFEKLDLKIYGYILPESQLHDGFVKIGETSREVESRVREQVSVFGFTPEILFRKKAMKANGDWFHDKELHGYFDMLGIPKLSNATEWYYFNDNLDQAEELTDKFIKSDFRNLQISQTRTTYILRCEQETAVQKTLDYYSNPIHGTEFLWNAKPRFGKTLTAYDFIRRANAKNVLIVTNRPAIANSWFDDFEKFIGWQEPKIKFVSDTDALGNKPMTRKQYVDFSGTNPYAVDGCIAFVSLQDIKGAKFAGGEYDKLEWLTQVNWDVLIIDEAHEGVDTFKTGIAFAEIQRKFTLHLSGTPFRAIADQKFHDNQIYNWSYVDEQKSKKNWDDYYGSNPYASLPTLNMFTYQMSKMIIDHLESGMSIDQDENIDYAFDLNEFFRTKDNGRFEYEDSIIKFLDNLTQRKFPFAETKYRHQLNHTFWLLPRVAAAKAMESLLQKHSFFSEYEIVLAAGDGVSLVEEVDNLETTEIDAEQFQKSYDKVKHAIKHHEKTITLSVGQLTTGVTIPEWTGVLILSNIKSPVIYFQSAFRAQNPYEFKDEVTGELLRKENAYVFDFAPERTLELYDHFANNLTSDGISGTTEARKEKIKELLNFFPVIAEDEDGELHEIDATEVLTIPNKLKSAEVVRRGFLSNLLFKNISSIFSAPKEIRDILEKIRPEKNKKILKPKEMEFKRPILDEKNEVDVPTEYVINRSTELFGEALIRIPSLDKERLEADPSFSRIDSHELANSILNDIDTSLQQLKNSFTLTNKQLDNVKENIRQEIERRINQHIRQSKDEFIHMASDNEIKSVDNGDKDFQYSELEYENKKVEEVLGKFAENLTKETCSILLDVIEEQISKEEEKKKQATEGEVRDRLRGFARTIPAFLMAFGSRETRLENYDDHIDNDTFKELTSISLDEFRLLRDGLEFEDSEGNLKKFNGLFDSVVFNASIQEFFNVKDKLADYLDDTEKEDIFDYIPRQETNQIFTPRTIVKFMVDALEAHNPNIFSDKSVRFLDMYAKSGLYLTEIIKRLDCGLVQQIPDKSERIKWILEQQIAAYSPSRIIGNIVRRYIFDGFDDSIRKNIIDFDLSKLKRPGEIKNKVIEDWGEEMKFDVIIGNPPYQEETEGTSDNPI